MGPFLASGIEQVVVYVGAERVDRHLRGRERVDRLDQVVGNTRPQAIWPPSQPRIAGERWSGAVASHMSASRPSGDQRLEWTWHDDPTSSDENFAMNVTARLCCAAISLTPFL